MSCIDAYRGIAALLVLLCHAAVTVGKDKYFGADPTHGLFQAGARGVDLFFVLSGFIITYVHWFDLGQPSQIGPYFVKRFIRLFPILWVVAIPFMVSSVLIKSEYMPTAWNQRAEVAVGSLLLLPTNCAPAPVVIWTLRHELLFYAVFALAIWRPRLGGGVFLLWGSLCAYHAASGFNSNFLSDFLLNPYNLEFLLGLGCGWIMRTTRVRFPAVLCLVGGMLFLAACVVYDPIPETKSWTMNPSNGWQVLQFGVSSALIVLGLAEIDVRRTLTPPRWLIFLGTASYSIYLIHFPIISVACKTLKAVDAHVAIAPLLAFLLAATTALAAGLMLHVYVEAPLLAFCRNLLLRRRKWVDLRTPAAERC
ncbi:MAG TPA: acyltransferase [Pirellulales bacterium]|nr:acyltransferase [Pirellulales bacterium]